MPDFIVEPDPVPSGRAATHEYIMSLLQDLANLAYGSGELPIAILLEAVIAADQAMPPPRWRSTAVD